MRDRSPTSPSPTTQEASSAEITKSTTAPVTTTEAVTGVAVDPAPVPTVGSSITGEPTSTPRKRINSSHRWTMVALVLLLAVELSLLLIYRRINLDEGWYLNAAKLVYEGKVLYQDFAYTQTPVLPYVYGLFQQIFGVGLYQGRLLTLLLALGAFLLSAATARRLAGPRAAVISLAILATSFFAATQYTYTATYALTAYLLAAAFYVALLDWHPNLRNGLATLFICLAVCTRLSTVVCLPPFLLYLWLTSEQKWRAFLVIGATTIASLGVILGLSWLRSGELMLYDIWGFHLDRILRTRWRLLKIQSRILRTALDFAVPILLCGWCTLWAGRRLWRNWRMSLPVRNPLTVITMVLVVVGLFVAHLVPRTTDSYYNALQMPLMSVIGAVLLARQLASLSDQGKGERQLRTSWLLWLVIGALASHSALQLRAMVRDGALTNPLQNQVAVVRHAASIVQQYVPTDQPFLTFNQHLALEADRRTPPGYEMSIFAYRPTWNVDQALRYKVINNTMLLDDLARPMPLAAFTEFDLEQLYGEREAFFAILHEHYRWFYTIPHFGPYGDILYLYVLPQFTVQPPPISYPATFADGIQLLGYDVQQDKYSDVNINRDETQLETQLETRLNVALYWQATAQPSREYTVFVQLLDANGLFVTGFDNPPCHRTCPTTSWQPGEFLRDEYQLSVTGLDNSQPFQLQIGMYNDEGTRLDVLAGNYAGEDRVILQQLMLDP